MKLTEQIYLVGSGTMGLRLSNELDCNVYLIDGGDEAVLIDAGGGVQPERIAQNIERDGIALSKLKTVLLTHAHGDHAAGARFWRDKYGCEIYCAKECAPWVENGDEAKISLDLAREAKIYPADFMFPSCPVERVLHEGDEIQFGDVTLQALETNGHARGHLGFYEPQTKALFAGDLVFPGGKIAPQVTWDFSIVDLKNSIAKIHDLDINALFAGHAAPLLTSARLDIRLAHEYLQALRFPKSLN